MHFDEFVFLFSTMSQQRQPILANLVPSPDNVQSSKSQRESSKEQSTSKQVAKTPKKPSRTLPTNRHDTSLSGRTQKKVRQEQDKAFLQHPYTLKLQTRKRKLRDIMLKIFNLADSDLIVCDAETGLNDYTKNLKFADELDDIAKHLIGLSQECTEKANMICDHIEQAKEDKRLIQDVVYLQEIMKPSEKDDFINERGKKPVDWVHTHQFPVKCECPINVWDSSDEETEPQNFSSDPDTRFKFTKENEFDEVKHINHICEQCDKVLRDSHELRNHFSNHHREIYWCLKCPKDIFRTEASYLQHECTHTGELFTFPACSHTFNRKTTLINHAITHNKQHLRCNKCGRLFKFRSSYLEHIRYRHLPNKSIECPVCHRMYWTPTAMRSH